MYTLKDLDLKTLKYVKMLKDNFNFSKNWPARAGPLLRPARSGRPEHKPYRVAVDIYCLKAIDFFLYMLKLIDGWLLG